MSQPDPPSADAASHDAPLRIDELRHGLRGLTLGNPLIYLPAVESTNTYAKALASAGAAEGALITTDHQTAGRGRVGRVWKPLPNQQLILSFILRPTFPAHYLVMASALATAEAIEATTPLRAQIKWPNDVLIEGRKVCGILIETSDGVAILGMGLNVNGSFASDSELAARATTLAAEAGAPIPREPLAIVLVSRLDALYHQLSTGGDAAPRALRDRWRDRLITLGRHVTIRQSSHQPDVFEGIAEDVDGGGALLLRRGDGGLITITWGDIE
jgi:BirA family transcriptional regulator, biotin operon repressor / biotin---[acetyl-CoA-carboxylase] ligase